MKSFRIVAVAGFLLASLPALAASSSVEWDTPNGTGQPPVTVVTPESARSIQDPMYVQTLIGKNDLCFRGSAQEVIDKILRAGLVDVGGDESCNQMKTTQNGAIFIGPCSQEASPTSYSLIIGRCR